MAEYERKGRNPLTEQRAGRSDASVVNGATDEYPTPNDAERQGTPKIELRGVSKAFVGNRTRTNALVDITLQVDAGEFVALLGASGCGKTTLLRIVDGLESATSGELYIDGAARLQPGPDRGFVFQQENLLPWRTVLRNVRFALELQGKANKVSKQQALEYIDLVGLKGFERYYPRELSGGMRQRVNLARAFCIEPEVLLMDEPFAALDAQTREVMQSELLRMWRETGGTVMFVTHQIDEAIFLADRIVVMTARPGQIKEIIDVGFERPRELGLKRSREFNAVYDHIWDLIEEEVRTSMATS